MGAEKIHHWGVNVSVNHQHVLTIESNSVAGKSDLSDNDLYGIRTAAQHLLAFAGNSKATPKSPPSPIPSLELAFIRWSVVHRQWHEHSGSMPSLEGFLAGWFCRVCEAEEPVIVDRFRDSFRSGWKEAHEQIVIISRQEKR